MPSVRKMCGVLLVCLTSSFNNTAHAQVLINVWGVAETSGIVNGVSYTDNNTQWGLNTQVQLHKNISVGGQLHYSKPDAVRQRHRGLSLYGAYDKALNPHWVVGTSIAHRQFSGGALKWDYQHVDAYVKHTSGISVGAMYSPDYYNSPFDARQLTLGYQTELTSATYIRSAVSQLDLESTLDYQHAQLAFGLNYHRLNVEISYYWVSDTLRPTPIGLIAPPKWQLRFMTLLY